MNERALVPYEPSRALAWLYHRFFEHIVVDEEWIRVVREADKRGTVVYVLRNLSFVDFLALDYLTKRLKLPQIRFANDLGLWLLEPVLGGRKHSWGSDWLAALASPKEPDTEDLKRVVTTHRSAALFLKRPSHLLEPTGRHKGKIEGDPFLLALFEAQRAMDRPILLVPQVFVWSKKPDDAKLSTFDWFLGPREWPGKIRTIAQFLMNYRHVTLRAGEPVNVREFLDSQLSDNARSDEGACGAPAAPGATTLPDNVLVRRLTYTLLRRLERERRSVIGPMRKPADRMREQVVRSPKLQKIIGDMAGEGPDERRVLTTRALSILREMEAAPDMGAIAAMDKVVDAILAQVYSDVEIDQAGLSRLRQAAKEGSLIFLPSHKSHMDYLLLAYLFYRNHLPMPMVAAGNNLAFFPLGPLLRRAGAFFIRRRFGGDRLYAAVVDAYMRRLIIDGFSLEFFIEGGRSRTGKLLPPKLGLLSLVVDAALSVTTRPIFFVPVSIGYERVLEEKAFVHELSGGDKRKEDVRGLLATANVLKGRYGRLNVQFGELLTLESVLREIDGNTVPEPVTPAKRRALVTRLAYRVMNEVNRVTAVTPGALVATALLTHGRRGITHPDLLEACQRLARTLAGFGARFTPSLVDPHAASGSRGVDGGVCLRPAALMEAIDLFTRAGHIEVRLPGRPLRAPPNKRPSSEGAVYVVPDNARLSLDLSKNIVIHFFVSRALVATAITAAGVGSAETRAPFAAVKARVQALSRLFKYEFQFRADATFDAIFDETICAMIQDGELLREAGDLVAHGDEGRTQVELYAQLLKNFVEAYRVAARGLLCLLRAPLSPKELTRRAMEEGERMFLAGEVERREAVCGAVIENAFSAFVDQGYLTRLDGKFSLPDSYATATAVRTIEGRMQGFIFQKEDAT